MIDTSPTPVVLADSLSPAGEGGVEHALSDGGAVSAAVAALEHVPPGLREAAARCIEERIEDAFDVPVVDILVGGWRKYEELVEAGKRTLEDPSSERIVALDAHDIVSTQRSEIDVTIDDIHATTVPLELVVTVHVETLVGVVRMGRLVELRSGRGTIAATLSCADVTVDWPPQNVDLQASISLGGGVVLVAD